MWLALFPAVKLKLAPFVAMRGSWGSQRWVMVTSMDILNGYTLVNPAGPAVPSVFLALFFRSKPS